MCEVNKVVLFSCSSARSLSASSPLLCHEAFLRAHFGNFGVELLELLWMEIKRVSNEQIFSILEGICGY